jgi:hypothetical protein
MNRNNEIAQIRARLDRKIEALEQLKQGFATRASHKGLLPHRETLGLCSQALVAPLVGERAVSTTLGQPVDPLI